MPAITEKITEHASTGAYAVVGAADTAVAEARELIERREELPTKLREAFDKAVEDLRDRLHTSRTEAQETVRTYADRGETVVAKLRGEADEAADQIEKRVRKATGEVEKTTRKASATVETKTSSRSSLANKTKAELYDLASDLDIEGRSNMNKTQLIEALSA